MTRGLLLTVALALAAAPLLAQERVDTVAFAPDTVDVPERLPVSPRGALLRSLVIPGWGQAAAGAYLRGGVYFAAQTGSAFMVWKAYAKIDEAQEIRDRRADAIRAEQLARAQQDTAWARVIAENPDTIAGIIAGDGYVRHHDNLIDARKEQREDWLAWLGFWTLASAVDAYVSAQLADFPAGLSVIPRGDGALAITATVRWGGGP